MPEPPAGSKARPPGARPAPDRHLCAPQRAPDESRRFPWQDGHSLLITFVVSRLSTASVGLTARPQSTQVNSTG